MTCGAVMFAFDNENVRYTDIAAWNAGQVQRWLDMPVTLITDRPCDNPVFDHVIIASRPPHSTVRWRDHKSGSAWFNQDRCKVYELSPYDQTLLIDADYIINSRDLLQVMSMPHDIMCFRHAHDIAHGSELTQHLTFGNYQMPMWWATVVMFRRSRATSMVFDSWQMIQQHWDHYRDIYHINQSVFRNDFALSIALCLTSGHTVFEQSIPWSMPCVMPGTALSMTGGTAEIQYHDHNQRPRRQTFRDQDFHAMDKFALGDLVGQSA